MQATVEQKTFRYTRRVRVESEESLPLPEEGEKMTNYLGPHQGGNAIITFQGSASVEEPVNKDHGAPTITIEGNGQSVIVYLRDKSEPAELA
ncbi:hypothetical protein ISS85_01985 [Candidatus Microgenomates bacterium]|nr:hypothetical protein [Candidatus Microgenomates bacterium]